MNTTIGTLILLVIAFLGAIGLVWVQTRNPRRGAIKWITLQNQASGFRALAVFAVLATLIPHNHVNPQLWKVGFFVLAIIIFFVGKYFPLKG